MIASSTPNSGRIHLRNVCFAYPTGPVIKGLSLEIGPSAFTAIMGPSGCGKSTLIAAIGGFIQPQHGEITVDGEQVTGPGRDRGVVFQQFALFPNLTVVRNVSYALKLAGVAPRLQRERAIAALEEVGLVDVADLYPHQLSVGMQQRVALVRSLIIQPKVLLLDEPFGALDALSRRQCHQHLMAIWERSRPTVLMVSHDIDECLLLADQVVVLGDRPARVKSIFPVQSPRARALLSDSQQTEASNTKRDILRLIDEGA